MLFLFLEICRFFLKDFFSLEKCKAALLDSGIKKNAKKRPKELIKNWTFQYQTQKKCFDSLPNVGIHFSISTCSKNHGAGTL